MDIEKILDNFNDPETACLFDSGEVQKNKIQAVLPYLIPILFFLPLTAENGKKSAFCKFHANQQFTWFIAVLVLNLIGNVIGIIPIFGGIINAFLQIAELLIALGLMYGAANGKALRLPFVGDLIDIF